MRYIGEIDEIVGHIHPGIELAAMQPRLKRKFKSNSYFPDISIHTRLPTSLIQNSQLVTSRLSMPPSDNTHDIGISMQVRSLPATTQPQIPSLKNLFQTVLLYKVNDPQVGDFLSGQILCLYLAHPQA